MSKEKIKACLERGGFVSAKTGVQMLCAFKQNDGTVRIIDEGVEMIFNLDNATNILNSMAEVVCNR